MYLGMRDYPQPGLSATASFQPVKPCPPPADSVSPCTRFTELPYRSFYRTFGLPQTPPDSPLNSPRVKLEGSFPSMSRECSPLPALSSLQLQGEAGVRLPSLEEFDQEVEAMARRNGHGRLYSPSSPLPSLQLGGLFPPRKPTTPIYPAYNGYSPYPAGDMAMHGSNMMGNYPTPPPEVENRHINQKYTTEQGDFIIYAWHDKNLKWANIREEFANRFGTEPERTIQGLQAWYYRMNSRIPVWDEDGWLVFENEDDLEPKSISIKCRDRDSQDKPLSPLGLAQRYPERAMNYSWVDPELKRKARDWALKRELQYRERREKRKRKEQRRLKM
ncbi:hypothetical protein CDD82_7506 [Ophiocordyceps australis]|uniref:Uncharacterized protein n=1 Tax=Ophiocordyceps australis TaxID=1399860 RepID=A0A2C5YSD1_9HYPO|nr:hypothetical protein CDD82_7506 [Ophiocordyceps australis]